MYSATLPYLRNNVLVFDIIKAEKILFWNYWKIVDTQFFTSESKTRIVILNFNAANLN